MKFLAINSRRLSPQHATQQFKVQEKGQQLNMSRSHILYALPEKHNISFHCWCKFEKVSNDEFYPVFDAVHLRIVSSIVDFNWVDVNSYD